MDDIDATQFEKVAFAPYVNEDPSETVQISHDDRPDPNFVYPLNTQVAIPGTNQNVFKTVLIEGTPNTRPMRFSCAHMVYRGYLEATSAEFDSCQDRMNPFSMPVGMRRFIRGWDEGVMSMNTGEKALIRIMPMYAYGEKGVPPRIPPNSVLIFEVELLSWTSVEDVSPDKDRSIIKHVRCYGDPIGRPNFPVFETTCTITVVANEYIPAEGEECGLPGAELFRRENWNVVIGVDDLPVGLSEALKKMRKSEKASVLVTAAFVNKHKAALLVSDESIEKLVWPAKDAASGELLEDKIAADKAVRYEIEMVEFSMLRPHLFKGMDKVAEALRRKDEANAFFSQKKWVKALAKYDRALEFIKNIPEITTERDLNEVDKLKSIIWGNIAQLYLNTGRNKEALEAVNSAIDDDKSGNNKLKNLFRRAKAKHALDDWDGAEEDLFKILEQDPANAPAKLEMEVIHARRVAYDKKQRAKFAGMF